MSPLEERIERARLEREAQERRAARRSHPGAEDSEPPLSREWPGPPIQGRPGDGNPSAIRAAASLDATHRAFVGVWGILAIIGAAILFGGSAAFFVANFAKKDTTDQIQRDVAELKANQRVNQAVVETTLTTIRGDVASIKDALHIAQQPPPLTPEKKPTPEKPHR